MTWKKTACVLCANGCGLEVKVENNRIVKARGDKNSPISEGYVCRKGRYIAHHQHNADRVLYPLKRVNDKFQRISWDQATGEISEKLKDILKKHGPRTLSSLLGGGSFSFLSMPFPVNLMRRLGSHYIYSAANQEFAGRYWAHGLTLGSQGIQMESDHENSDMLMLIGKNPMMSHHYSQARKRLKKISKDPDQLLVVVDPRVSETAKIADIHLAIRPGTDALMMKSMISIILDKGLYDKEYVAKHADGFNEILPWFADFDAKAALKVCELDFDLVVRVCQEFATRRSHVHDDLGILMNRHSALVSYLIVVLLALCGRIGVPGGNYLGGGGPSRDPRDPRLWRTLLTDIPSINGAFPPNVLQEEILNDHPEHIRAVLCGAANPLRSYADTTAYENAFAKLDLLVVVDVAMSETAALADYVLPCKTVFESWDGHPGQGVSKVYARMKSPVVEAEGEQKENAEIFTLLADAMGLLPEIPESLYEAAKTGLAEYRQAFFEYMMASPESGKVLNFIVAKTLGPALGSAHLASIFPMFMQLSERRQEAAAKVGFPVGPDQGLAMFQSIMDHPEGTLIGLRDPEGNMGANISTENNKIQLFNPEVDNWIKKINPAEEEKQLKMDEHFPLILMAGRHMDTNANTAMRDPAWITGKRACTLAINPSDAKGLGIVDEQLVKVVTEAGEETIEAEVTTDARKGQVIIPHGFGLIYDGVKYGTNVNRLTKNTNRDFVGTPMHRFVPCRVEATE